MVLKPLGNSHDLPLFHKFDTRILVTTKYYTIIFSIDVDTQTANTNKIFNDLDSITLLSTITFFKSSYMAIHLDPNDFLYERFPLAKRWIGQLSTFSMNSLYTNSSKLDNFQLRLMNNFYLTSPKFSMEYNEALLLMDNTISKPNFRNDL